MMSKPRPSDLMESSRVQVLAFMVAAQFFGVLKIRPWLAVWYSTRDFKFARELSCKTNFVF